MVVPALALAVLRIFAVRLLGAGQFTRALSAALLAAALLSMWVYYGAVVVGLKAWGRVISVELIATYLDQASAFAEALAIPLWLVAAGVMLAYAAMFAAAWFYLRALDWVAPLLARFSETSCAIGAGIALAACAAELALFFTAPPVDRFEPVSLTLYPDLDRRNFQGNFIYPMRAAAIDAADDAERKRYVASTGGKRRNVVLIVVDALRPDHMGVYGYARDTTPHLSELQRAGGLQALPPARASCGSSSCGIMSLLASRFVHEFSARPFTLFEVLKRHGYAVHLLLGGDHTHFYGLNRVYEPHDSYFDGSKAGRTLDYKNDDRLLVEHVAGLPRWDGQPAMLYFHLMSVHPIGKRYPQFDRYHPASPYMPSGRTDVTHAVNDYDNRVLQADAVIGEILNGLRARGYLDDALVVITADHGEALGEHGGFGHPQHLEEAVLRVPLVFIANGHERQKLAQPGVTAGQVDIAPTLLAELGIEAPHTWSGAPLQRPHKRDFAYAVEADTACIIDYRDPAKVWKYRIDRRSREEDAFDLTRDPLARVNVIGEASPALRHDWRAEFARTIAGPSELVRID